MMVLKWVMAISTHKEKKNNDGDASSPITVQFRSRSGPSKGQEKSPPTNIY
jgi:hypothetical protein